MRDSKTEEMRGRLADGLALAERLGADAAKMRYRQSESMECGFEAGRLKNTGSCQSMAYSIEVLLGKKRGAASGNRPEDVPALVERAVTLAKVGAAAHFDAYPAPGPTTPVKRHSAKTLSLSREKMIAACEAMVAPLKEYNPDLFLEAAADRDEEESLLLTSGGVSRVESGTGWSLSVMAQRTQGTDVLFAGHGRSWRDFNALFDPAYLAEKTLLDLRRSEQFADAPKGKTAVILPPEMVRAFLWVVALGVNGRNVAKGDSPLKGRLDEQIFDPALSLTDDPHCDFSYSACAVDADGVPTRKWNVAERGVLRHFLYDLDTAGLAKTTPTGNNGCMPYRLLAAPGELPHEKLSAEIADGLWLVELVGFGQGNIINGDFSCNVGLGWRIKNGALIGRVKDTMVAGNIYELLKNVRLSSDCDPVSGLPYMLLDGVSVSSK
jgi:PmbA protein